MEAPLSFLCRPSTLRLLIQSSDLLESFNELWVRSCHGYRIDLTVDSGKRAGVWIDHLSQHRHDDDSTESLSLMINRTKESFHQRNGCKKPRAAGCEGIRLVLNQSF